MKLVDNAWKSWWTWASTRVSMLAGIITAYFAANPEQWARLMDYIPEGYKAIGIPLIGITVTLVSGGSRMIVFKADKT